MNKFFPLFINLQDRQIVVIGAGEIASRRIATLLQFCENFTVIAPEISDAVLAQADRLCIVKRRFDWQDLATLTAQDLVLALTDDHKLNAEITAYCKARAILCNSASKKEDCTFYFPAVVQQDHTVIGITASGQNHHAVKHTRERIQAMMKKSVIIGSRESKLAVIQSSFVLDYLQEQGVSSTLLTMKTTGDRILDRKLDEIGGKGLFTKELDIALLEHRSDLSVHSLKDMPMDLPASLPILGYSKREDPRDVLILPQGMTDLRCDLPIGCSSNRRILQLQKVFPEVTFKSVRGNLITRLEKLDRLEYGGLILASAGIKRLGLEHRIARYFTVEEVLPAGGQGILAVQGRQGENYSDLDGFFDRTSYYMATAERAFVQALDGGCSSPIAAYATVADDTITLTGLYYNEQTKQYHTDHQSAPVAQAEALGRQLANRMKAKG